MKFEKVSFDQFNKDVNNLFDIHDYNIIKTMYDTITIPRRSTSGSAGYDFVLPFGFDFLKDTNITIPTGIRCTNMPNDVVLMVYPRSGLGFKYRTSLANTVGIIDSDYANAKNEGHIMIKLINDGFILDNIIDNILITNKGCRLSVSSPTSSIENYKPEIHFNPGDKFCQAVFTYCLFTEDDSKHSDIDNVREGGFGSTGN